MQVRDCDYEATSLSLAIFFPAFEVQLFCCILPLGASGDHVMDTDPQECLLHTRDTAASAAGQCNDITGIPNHSLHTAQAPKDAVNLK